MQYTFHVIMDEDDSVVHVVTVEADGWCEALDAVNDIAYELAGRTGFFTIERAYK